VPTLDNPADTIAGAVTPKLVNLQVW